MTLFKSFALGVIYLVSGVYSLGFGVFVDGLMQPVSGTRAYVMSPDALFPYEVILFILFGVVFLAAGAFHIRKSLVLLFGLETKQVGVH